MHITRYAARYFGLLLLTIVAILTIPPHLVLRGIGWIGRKAEALADVVARGSVFGCHLSTMWYRRCITKPKTLTTPPIRVGAIVRVVTIDPSFDVDEDADIVQLRRDRLNWEGIVVDYNQSRGEVIVKFATTTSKPRLPFRPSELLVCASAQERRPGRSAAP